MSAPNFNSIEIGLARFREVLMSLREPIALDIETSGLDPFVDKVTWISWATKCRHGVVPIFHRNPSTHNCPEEALKEQLSSLLRNPLNTTIWHNGTFDLSFLVARGWIKTEDIRCKIFDTMLASYVLNPVKTNENGRHALKWLYKEHLEHRTGVKQPSYQETTQSRELADVDFARASLYAAFDAWSTRELYEIFAHDLKGIPHLAQYFERIEMPHVLTTVEIQTSGLHLRPQDSLPIKITQPNGKTLEIKDMSALYGEYDFALQKVFRLAGKTFKFSSPSSLRSILFHTKGLSPLGRGKKSKKYLIDKYTLTRIYAEQTKRHPKRLISYVLYAKLLQEVIKKHEEFYHGVNRKTGLIHPKMRQTTSSGRYSCKSPNTLSMSSVSNIKHHIIPGKGKAFVVADFSQIDLRVIANETGVINKNSGMLAAVNKGYDLHTLTLSIVRPEVAKKKVKRFHADYYECDGEDDVRFAGNPSEEDFVKRAKKDRSSIAKPLNFGISYGLGAKGLLANLNNSEKFQEVIADLTNAKSDIVWIELLDEQTKQAKANKRTLAEAESFLETFKTTYPEIPGFQSDIEENGLQVDGSTVNIFGRRSLAEGIQHLLKRNAVIDVISPSKEWFRVTCNGLKFDESGLDVFIKKVEPLQINRQTDKRTIVGTEPLYSAKIKKFNLVTDRLCRGLIDEHEWRALMFKAHYESMWGAELFFDTFKPASPNAHSDLANMSEHPCAPFIHFTHAQIQYIQTGPLATFMRYPGYDALRRKLISYRVSSSSMDICKIAMIRFRVAVKRLLKRGRIKSLPKIVNCIHDEIAVECEAADTRIIKWTLDSVMRFEGFNVKHYLAEGRTLLVRIEAESNSSDSSYALAKPA